MFKLFERLLPRGGEAFRLPFAGKLRAFIEGLSEWANDAREYIDSAWFGIDPWLTDNIEQMERDLGIYHTAGLTQAERRDRVAGIMAQDRSQSVTGVQEILRANGFDLYLYDTFRHAPIWYDEFGGIIYTGTILNTTNNPSFWFEFTGTLFKTGPVLVQWKSGGAHGAGAELAIHADAFIGAVFVIFRGQPQSVVDPGAVDGWDDNLVHKWRIEYDKVNWKTYRDGELVSTNPVTYPASFTRYGDVYTSLGLQLNAAGQPTGGTTGGRTMYDIKFAQDDVVTLDIKGDDYTGAGPEVLRNRVYSFDHVATPGLFVGTEALYVINAFNWGDPTPPLFWVAPGPQSFLEPPAANPFFLLAPDTATEPAAGQGYPLVNKIYETTRQDIGMGDPGMNMGDDGSAMGEYSAYAETRRVYRLPVGYVYQRAICYVGAKAWPTLAQVPASRRDELEALVLRHLPAHVWAGMMIEYTDE